MTTHYYHDFRCFSRAKPVLSVSRNYRPPPPNIDPNFIERVDIVNVVSYRDIVSSGEMFVREIEIPSRRGFVKQGQLFYMLRMMSKYPEGYMQKWDADGLSKTWVPTQNEVRLHKMKYWSSQ